MPKAIFDIDSSPELSAYALSKSAGDDCEITIKGKFISADGGKLEMDMEELEYMYDDELESIETEDEGIGLEVLLLSDMEEEASNEGREVVAEDDESFYEEEEV